MRKRSFPCLNVRDYTVYDSMCISAFACIWNRIRVSEPFCSVCRFVSVYWGICFRNCSIFRLDQDKVVEDSINGNSCSLQHSSMIHCVCVVFLLSDADFSIGTRNPVASKSKSISFLLSFSFSLFLFYANAFDCVVVSCYLCALEIIYICLHWSNLDKCPEFSMCRDICLFTQYLCAQFSIICVVVCWSSFWIICVIVCFQNHHINDGDDENDDGCPKFWNSNRRNILWAISIDGVLDDFESFYQSIRIVINGKMKMRKWTATNRNR